METNTFFSDVKLHLATDVKHKYREDMEYIHFRNGYAYASDGRILVRASIANISNMSPVDFTDLDGWSISAELYKQVLKYDDVTIGDGEIVCKRGKDSVGFKMKKFEKLLDFEAVIKPAKEDDGEASQSVCINTKHLDTLASAMGAEHVKMKLRGGKGILVTHLNADVDIIGVIMPLREN